MKFKLGKITTAIVIIIIANSKISAQDYHWQFDNNKVVSTNGYSTSLEIKGNTTEMFIPGKINKAISFDNAKDFPYSKNISLGSSGSYSLSFWVNTSSSPESEEEYFIANKREGGNQFQIFINDFDQLEFYLFGSNTSAYTHVVSNETIPCNIWSHVTITVSNEPTNRFITMYINGVQINKEPFYFTPKTMASTLVFGSKFVDGRYENLDANGENGDSRDLKGALDSFRINGGRVISYEEIQSLANKNPEPNHRWKFDEYQTKLETDTYVSIVKDFYGHKDGLMNRIIPRVEGKIGYSAIKLEKNLLNYIAIDNVETSKMKSYSLSFWIKPIDNYPSSTYTLLKKRDTKNQYQVGLLPNGQIRFHLWGNGYASVTSDAIAVNNWTNIVITVDNLNKEIIVYKNGDKNQEEGFIFEPWYGIDQLIIGENINTATSDILLDDVRVYNNKVLDTDLVAEINNYSELPSPVTAPITYDKYYKSEYQLYDYDPNFVPGPVTFDENNIPYIRKEDYVQTIENGKWVRFSFYDVLKKELEKLDGIDVWNGNYDKSEGYDTRIIFDDDGWAYTYVSTNIVGKNLVLYSTDKCRTWKALSKHIAEKNALWESRQVHGDLKLPPVLLSTKSANTTEEVKKMDLYFFKKNADILKLEKVIAIDSVEMGVGHSGAPPQIVTKDNTSFLIYSKRYRKEQDHPGNETYIAKIKRDVLPDTVDPSNNIYIGNAGENKFSVDSYENITPGQDSHNYGSLVIDSNGYLHAVLSGHHDQDLKYTKSKKPYANDNKWEEIKPFGSKGTKDGHTYNTLVCDENNTLHCITRWTGNNYEFRIAYLTKKEGKEENWSKINTLLIPFTGNYHKWYHKLSIDRQNNLYMNYQLNFDINLAKGEPCGTIDNSNLAIKTYKKNWPEDDIQPQCTDDTTPKVHRHYIGIRPKFPSMLKLKSGKQNWELVTTKDFLTTSPVPKQSNTSSIFDETDSSGNFLLHPNPTNGYLTVQLPTLPDQNSFINIYNLLGQKITSFRIKDLKTTIPMFNLEKGIYLIEMTGNNNGTKKIVID